MVDGGLEPQSSDSTEEVDFETYIREYDLEALANGSLDDLFVSGNETCQYHLHAKRKCKPCNVKKLEVNLGFCKTHTSNYVAQIKREIESRAAKENKQNKAKLIDLNCRESVEQGRDMAREEESKMISSFNESLRKELESGEGEINLISNNNGVKIEDDDELEDCSVPETKIWIEKGNDTIDTGGDEEDFEIVPWAGRSRIKINPEVDDEQTIMEKMAFMEREKEINTTRQSLNIDLAKDLYFDMIGYMCLKSGKKKMYGLPKALREDPSTKKLFGKAMLELADDVGFDLAGMPSYGTLALRHGYIAMKMLIND